MDMEILERVKTIVANQFGVNADEITESTNFEENLNADSLDLVEITMSLEEEFGVDEIEEETLETIRTVGDVVKLIASKQ